MAMPKCFQCVFAALLAVLATSTANAQQRDPQDGSTQTVGSAAAPAQDDDEGFVTKARSWADKTQIVERLNGDVDGWYPRLGGMTRGSGFAIGPGYRFHTFDDRIFVDLSAGISIKGYKAVDANVRWLQAFDERLELWTDFRYEDFPQEDFFGMGFSSSLDNRTSYDFDSSDIAVRGLFSPVQWLRL